MKKVKGVSPIVAVLLLIVIAVAAAAMTYGFVMGFIGGAATTTTTTQAMIRVEAVDATTGTDATVYVRNIGSIPVTVDFIYVYHANGTLMSTQRLSTSITIPPGNVGIVYVDGLDLSGGVTYYVKVTTKEGAIATSEPFKVKS
ncbi:MAG: type IV pilin [Candidatus Nezhaarchaeales archaeon]